MFNEGIRVASQIFNHRRVLVAKLDATVCVPKSHSFGGKMNMPERERPEHGTIIVEFRTNE